MSTYTEDHLVEQPAVQLMQHELGWDVVNCYDEWSGGVSNQGRDGKREVVLVSRLRPALQRLNPDLPVEAIEGAVEEICRDRTALSLAEANREIDKLLKQGVKVSFHDPDSGWKWCLWSIGRFRRTMIFCWARNSGWRASCI